MPAELERKLKAEAKKKGLSKKRMGAYVYGTMNKLGLMKGNKVMRTAPGISKKVRKELNF